MTSAESEVSWVSQESSREKMFEWDLKVSRILLGREIKDSAEGVAWAKEQK